jgi:uncharacterized protein YggT (Ycf19 family)
MQSLHPMRANQSPAPTTPIAPTAPTPPIDSLESPVTYQPVQPVAPVHLVQPMQPMQPAQPLQRSPGVSVAERAAMITYLVLGVVEALLITRVILKLLAANPGSSFVRFVYTVSAPLVAPFQGIFPTPATQNSVLELSSLVAIAVYALIAWGIVRLIAIFGQRQSLS